MTTMSVPFPSCCGASIITSFSSRPEAAFSYKRKVGGSGFDSYEKDENGRPIVEKTHGEQFVEDSNSATFSSQRYPAGTIQSKDRAWMLIISDAQLRLPSGPAWLALFKKEGYEFVRAWRNSYHGNGPGSILYLFVKVSNKSGAEPDLDHLKPPKGWDNLEKEIVLDETPTAKAA